MYVSLTSKQDLWFVDTRMSCARADILHNYIKDYFEPVLKNYPELIGKIHLSLRSEGFFFRNTPHYEIVVNSQRVNEIPTQRLRFATAYMLAHFCLNLCGYDLTSPYRGEKYTDRRAVFFAFSRGYAYDYLQAFAGGCKKEYCDFREKLHTFGCSEFFPVPCRAYTISTLGQLAKALQNVALQCNYGAEIDFQHIIKRAWMIVLHGNIIND